MREQTAETVREQTALSPRTAGRMKEKIVESVLLSLQHLEVQKMQPKNKGLSI